MSSQENDREDILRKVEKLFALASANSSAAEIAAATAKAQELMSRYQVTELELAAQQQRPVTDFIKHQVQIGDFGQSREWKRDLIAAIARANMSRTVFIESAPIVYIVGTKSNTQMVELLYRSVAGLIWRAAEATKELRRPGVHVRTWTTSFAGGAVYEVRRRLVELSKSMADDQAETTKALVVQNSRAVEDAMESMFSRLGTRQVSPYVFSGTAYSQGREFGKTVDLTSDRRRLGPAGGS